jgi:hypothetical protein
MKPENCVEFDADVNRLAVFVKVVTALQVSPAFMKQTSEHEHAGEVTLGADTSASTEFCDEVVIRNTPTFWFEPLLFVMLMEVENAYHPVKGAVNNPVELL